jgi:hypothetical protein
MSNANKKFIDEISLPQGWEILSDDGWQPISTIYKTIPYQVWRMELQNGLYLDCADTHIIFDEYLNEIYVKDVVPFVTKISTEFGPRLVTKLETFDVTENMYDISVESPTHRFYSNGILSHNTTTVSAYFLWYSIFNPDKTCAILANKRVTAFEILDKVQKAYTHLPIWLQSGVVEFNKSRMVLENGSRIIAEATSSAAIRGFSINMLLLDEFSFVPSAMANEFFTAVFPTISSGKDTRVYMVSTPLGLNHFYKFYNDAVLGLNGFAHIHIKWDRHPDRDAKWEENQRKILGDLKFSQEMEADFQGSSNTLLNSTCIKNLVYKTPVLINDCLKIYQPPIEGNLYVMTVDVSRGQSLDYSAFKIFDITDSPYRVVANYNSNEIPPILYPNVIHKVAKDYNECYVLIELNDIGSQVIDILHTDLEYENVLYSTDGMITEWGKMGKAGLRTTQRSKRIGCSALKSLMENHKLIDNDFDTIVQLSTFIATKTSFEADSGCHDDLVMCLVLFAYLSTQQFFKDVTNVNIRNMIYENQMTRIENELTPYGYIDNGIDTIEPDLDIVGKEVWIPANQSYSDFIKDYWN